MSTIDKIIPVSIALTNTEDMDVDKFEMKEDVNYFESVCQDFVESLNTKGFGTAPTKLRANSVLRVRKRKMNRYVKTCKTIHSGRDSIKCRFCDFGLHPNSSKQWLPCNQFNDECDFVTKSFVEFRRHMLKAHNLKVNCKFQGRPRSTSLLKQKS